MYGKPVLQMDIAPETAERDISAAIGRYKEQHGDISHVWVNPKDVPEELVKIDTFVIERKGGMPRLKVWVT